MTYKHFPDKLQIKKNIYTKYTIYYKNKKRASILHNPNQPSSGMLKELGTFCSFQHIDITLTVSFHSSRVFSLQCSQTLDLHRKFSN